MERDKLHGVADEAMKANLSLAERGANYVEENGQLRPLDERPDLSELIPGGCAGIRPVHLALHRFAPGVAANPRHGTLPGAQSKRRTPEARPSRIGPNPRRAHPTGKSAFEPNGVFREDQASDGSGYRVARRGPCLGAIGPGA